MPKPRGPYRKKFKSKFENSEQRQIASWTNDNYHKNWLYLQYARGKKIKAENQFIKTKNIKYLRKAKIHNFKAKQILFEGINLYEETVEELQLIVKQIALELYPQEKELINKKITRTAIEELQLYSSRGESPENPIEITQQQSDFKRKFDELLDTPKINKDPTISLEELTQPPLSEEEKQQRLERLQVLKEEVDTKYSELDLYILALEEQKQQPNFAVGKSVATENFQSGYTELISENTRSRKRQRLGKD